MRRRSSRALPVLTDDALAPPAGRAAFAATIPLKTITPIVGGGVEPGEPDGIDAVRLPSVRGMLRWWWRALFQATDDSPEDVFERESALWGGVDVGPQREGRRSRVRLLIGPGARPGSSSPAGHHQLNQRETALNALPDWFDRDLGYALFPLQRSESERQKAFREGKRTLPTAAVRRDLRFDLRVEVWPTRAGGELGAGEVSEVLCALWAWVHLGGLGARTRRGFGALELAGKVAYEGSAPVPLSALGSAFASGWELVQRQSRPGSLLHKARLMIGPASADAGRAHASAVAALRRFRQAPFGRSQTAHSRYGHSNWPEADTLRSLATGTAAGETNGCAPRAAFGLPIEFAFKDSQDKPAEASIRSSRSNRWSSPLLLRPARLGDREYRPLALALPSPPPARIEVHFKARETRRRVESPAQRPPFPTLPVKCSDRARPPVLALLDRHRGDALDAFWEWLGKEGFRPAVPAGGARP